MPCYRPLTGYRAERRNTNGKRPVVFSGTGHLGIPVVVPCGRCIGCRLENGKSWAIRCVHESQMHAENSFLTLTYADDNQHRYGLDVGHVQKFMKRLRKAIAPKRVRYFHCGEYGEKFSRPHYHLLLFGHWFADSTPWRKDDGNQIFLSEQLSKLWPHGFSTIGELTYQSAAYCSRYVTKKVSGPEADTHYGTACPVTGEWFEISPEYATMSRRPGIGAEWIEKYWRDVFPDDFVVLDGRRHATPDYYLGYLAKSHPALFEQVEKKRLERQADMAWNETEDRLAVREYIQYARLERYSRQLEE